MFHASFVADTCMKQRKRAVKGGDWRSHTCVRDQHFFGSYSTPLLHKLGYLGSAVPQKRQISQNRVFKGPRGLKLCDNLSSKTVAFCWQYLSLRIFSCSKEKRKQQKGEMRLCGVRKKSWKVLEFC